MMLVSGKDSSSWGVGVEVTLSGAVVLGLGLGGSSGESYLTGGAECADFSSAFTS